MQTRSARSPSSSRSTISSSTCATTPSSRRTGRSRARTTSSATTARSRTKGFSAAYDVDPDEYRLEPIAEHVLSQFAQSRREGEAQFHFVWPNLRLNAYAGTPNLSIGPLLPAGPERSTGFLDYFFAPDADPAWVDELLEFDRQVGAEDRVLVERVQKGVRSGIVAEGQLLGESEQLVARFQQLVAQAVA